MTTTERCPKAPDGGGHHFVPLRDVGSERLTALACRYCGKGLSHD